jgi:hypothetical protein
MDLSAHIYHLLYRHDCVVIPGFGGLVGTYKKVEFNPHAGYIMPARKTVAFNQNLTAYWPTISTITKKPGL